MTGRNGQFFQKTGRFYKSTTHLGSLYYSINNDKDFVTTQPIFSTTDQGSERIDAMGY